MVLRVMPRLALVPPLVRGLKLFFLPPRRDRLELPLVECLDPLDGVIQREGLFEQGHRIVDLLLGHEKGR